MSDDEKLIADSSIADSSIEMFRRLCGRPAPGGPA